MGLFDFFGKKDKQPDKPSDRAYPKQNNTSGTGTNAAADKIFGEQKVIKPRTDKDIIVETLIASTLGGRRESETSGTVIYDYEGFELTNLDISFKEVNGFIICETLFFIALPEAESLVCVKPFGKGLSRKEALISAANHMAGILNSCFSAVHDRNTVTIENCYDGKTHTYRYPSESIMSGILKPEIPQPMSLFSCIAGDISEYLGAKKYHWVNLNYVFDGRKCYANVEINGDDCRALSEKLYTLDRQLVQSSASFFYSQSILLVQNDDTYEKCKDNYNAACNAMYEYVRTVLPLMGESSEDDSFGSVAERVEAAVCDSNTAWELMTFLPDVFTRTALNINCGDTVIMHKDGMTLTLNEQQLTPFHVLNAEVKNYIKDHSVDGRFISRVMSLSPRFSVYADSPTGELIVSGMIECTAPEGYVIW